MTSLFDLAAELRGLDGPHAPPETALGILDDALQSLYGGRAPPVLLGRTLLGSAVPSAAAPAPAPTITDPHPRRSLGPSKSVSSLSDRLDQLVGRARASDAADADRDARDALRELGEEVEMLQTRPLRTGDDGAHTDQAAALLEHKYLDQRLDTLPGSPFVLLARRKARLRISQLRTALGRPHAQRSVPKTDEGSADEWRRTQRTGQQRTGPS